MGESQGGWVVRLAIRAHLALLLSHSVYIVVLWPVGSDISVIHRCIYEEHSFCGAQCQAAFLWGGGCAIYGT